METEEGPNPPSTPSTPKPSQQANSRANPPNKPAPSRNESARAPIEVSTENDHMKYHYFPNSSGLFQFKVRAKHDAHIALTSTATETDPMYEVFIGGWKNTKSVIRKNRTKPDVTEIESPGIMSEEDFKGFWIRWENLTVTVGRQGESAPFMSYVDKEKVPIKFVGVATGWGSTGSWILEQPPLPRKSANVGPGPLHVSTEDDYYHYFANSSGLFQFIVRAANDASIALTRTESETDPMYEVFIGVFKNAKSVIRRNRTQIVVETLTPGIISERDFKGFWIRWNPHVISVGKQGESVPFMNHIEEEKVEIKFVGVGTGGGATGSWFLDPPRPIEVNTEDKLGYHYFPVPENCDESFQFVVRAPRYARVALTTTAAETNPMYEVIIGGWKNTKSAIRKNRADPNLVEVLTPGIMSEKDSRGFWIDWHNLTIAVGKQNRSEPFMTYTDKDKAKIKIKFVGVSTGLGATGSWAIEQQIPVGPSWIAAERGSVPAEAFPGGEENGEPVYVIRAVQDNNLVPGRLVSSRRASVVGWDGKETTHPKYEVLTSYCGAWKKNPGKTVPNHALAAGKTKDGGDLYVGRAMHKGHMTVGKVFPQGVCYILSDGQDVTYEQYEILVHE